MTERRSSHLHTTYSRSPTVPQSGRGEGDFKLVGFNQATDLVWPLHRQICLNPVWLGGLRSPASLRSSVRALTAHLPNWIHSNLAPRRDQTGWLDGIMFAGSWGSALPPFRTLAPLLATALYAFHPPTSFCTLLLFCGIRSLLK